MPPISLPHPVERRACPIFGCDRAVGPYCDPRQADAALADHVHVAHQAVRQATPAVSDEASGRLEWPPART